jgi:amino acid adenylation domain-containing protein
MAHFIEFFRTVCEQHPNRVALDDGQRQVSYGELWHLVEHSAVALPPNSLIGLSLCRSIDYVIGLLACWRAGSAFVPIDPALPEKRRRSLIESCSPDLILEAIPSSADQAPSSEHTTRIAQPVGAERVQANWWTTSGTYPAVSGSEDGQASRGGDRPTEVGTVFGTYPAVSGTDLAYLICTSGSAGKPKVVEIVHDGIVPMLLDQIQAFGLEPGKRVGWMLSVQFDASLSDIGTALLSGSALCPAPDCAALDLPNWLQQQRITHLDIPPALLRRYQAGQFPEMLETLVSGGEPSPPEVLRAWAKHHRLINVYGPTEATVCTSLCQVDDSWVQPRLGLPIAGMEHRQVGDELYISGPGLARGYRDQPDLERQCFVELDGRRYYRSGDKVEALGNGDFIFKGRLDRQLKLHGQRIEPEEIEEQALRLPGIVRCQLVPGERHLSLFYEGTAEPEVVREWLGEHLPKGMVPGHIQQFDRLPTTASGKLDPTPLRLIESYLKNGLDSLGALELAALLQSQGHAVSPLQLVSRQVAMPSQQLREIANSLPITSVDFHQPSSGNRLLITGATGHLGGRLLQSLCEDHQCFCLVRDPSKLPNHPNIIPIVGDLGADINWDDLPETDQIVHCAGTVNTILPLESLRAVNLDCLPGLVAYASRGITKPIHFASTLSVFVSTDFVGLALESDTLENPHTVFGGYAQSKWAAEAYLRRWDGPVHFYRYGLLVEHPSHDFVQLFLEGMASLGCRPRGSTIRVDMTPIDFAAKATLELMKVAPTQEGTPVKNSAVGSGERPDLKLDTLRNIPRAKRTYHIANRCGVSLDELLATWAIPEVEAQEFFARPAKTSQEALAQLALCRLHSDRAYFERNRSLDLFQATDVQFELTSLEHLGLSAPAGVPIAYQKGGAR